ncbi:MAG: enoyl-CoA hydratase-related protein, partial [Firmicutes bacterium]|nr:enoyl-CoA hydratase-related protein [Bacillota bacterium]
MPLTQVEEFSNERIAVITLNNPKRRNALSRALLAALADDLDSIGQSRAVNVVIIRSQGPVFSAGHDLHEILDQDLPEVRTLFRQCAQTMAVIRRLPQLVLAEVSGIATAAGCQLVAACDMAIAADTARFATPGVKIGYFCASPSVQVARNIPLKRAAEMLFTGDFIDAEEAKAYGLVNRVVSLESLSDSSWQFAQELSRWSLPVIAAGKEFLYHQIEMTEDAAAHYGVEFMTRQSSTEDAAEGINAFFEKRAPKWS